jgi:hypothetical protein
MLQTMVKFNDISILVEFVGTDQKQIPQLLSALKNNKITVSHLGHPSHIQLFTTEAFLHSRDGDIYRIPIF